MARTIRNRFASALFDPSDTARMTFERTVRDGRVVWVDTNEPDMIVAEGNTAAEADAAIRAEFSNPALGFKMTGYGLHRLTIA